jgi:ADP-ribose pyrophosphatase YjhB (NUDIX family)
VAEIAGAHDIRDVDEIEKLYDGGRILLIQRKDDGLWAMPGGILEVGETQAEGSAERHAKRPVLR